MKTMWVVSGVSLAKVEISRETDKTYWIASNKTLFGYISGVWAPCRVRKSDMDKQWFDDRTQALVCLIENQRQRVDYLQEQMEKRQAELDAEKKRLAELEAQFAYYESPPPQDKQGDLLATKEVTA